MICKNCGKELPDGVNFCKFCGTKIINSGDVVNIDLNKEKQDTTIKVLIEKENDSNIEVNIKEVKDKKESSEEIIDVVTKEEPKQVSKMQQALNNLSNKTKKCQSCGMLIIDNARFCTNCGMQIK